MNLTLNSKNRIFYFSCARHAFKESLITLNLSKLECVLLPEFICRDLLSSVVEAKINYTFYPVDKELKPIRLPTSPKIKVVLAVNYFGFPQELEIFEKYCIQNECLLIEDNAHGFLSLDQLGRELGKRGKIGFTSFRKTIPVYNGSALYINDKNIECSNIPIVEPSYRRLPLRFQIKKVSRLIDKTINLNLKNYLEDISRLLRFIFTGSKFPKTTRLAEVKIGWIKNIHISTILKLKKFEMTKNTEIKRRQKLFYKFKKILKNKKIYPIYDDLPINTCPYGYPFISDDENAKIVMKLAKAEGFTCVKWPELPIEIESHCPNFYKSIYFVDFLE